MADLVLERWTACPTGNPDDVRSFEVVLTDDDSRSMKESTPRTTVWTRVFTRGDLTVLGPQVRDLLLTTGRGAGRRIEQAIRISAEGHINTDISGLALAVRFPRERGAAIFIGGDVRIEPSSSTAPLPTPRERLEEFRARKGTR